VNHELRAPLIAISGYADVLRATRSELSADETDEFLEIIARQSQHLSRLVDDILVLLRLEAGRLTVSMCAVAVDDIVTNVEQSVDVPRDRHLRRRIEGGLMVTADPDRLFQVLRNLVENAIKYGGPQIQVVARRVGEMIRIEVLDDGAGIPADRVDELFEEYTRLESPRGLGLGLSIVKLLIEAMGGTIGYEGAADGTAGFVLMLPQAGPAAARQPDRSATFAGRSAGSVEFLK